jgi:uncharacterized membrane protein
MRRGLAFLPVRFPFTFLGVMALLIGAWIVVYLTGHRLDPASQALALATVLVSWGFGLYVVVRRVRRGPEH